jgi:WD40 repeat protein
VTDNLRVPSYIGRVLGPSGSAVGTCFWVTKDVLITACHVLGQFALKVGSEVQVDGLDGAGQRLTAQVLAMNPSTDVAVMRSSLGLATSASVIAATDTVPPFTRVLMTGVADIKDTHKYDWIETTGEWQGNVRRDGLNLGWLQSKSVVPGMSGSPVRRAGDGAVIGLVSARYNSQGSWMRDSVWVARTEDILDLLRQVVPPAELPSLDVREDSTRSGLSYAGRKMIPKKPTIVVRGDGEPVSSAVFDEFDDTGETGLYEKLDLARFTGRRQLIADIDEFIATSTHGWVVVTGGAGVGKSALAAHLVWSRGWFYHFTRHESARSPESARKSLAAQLIGEFELDDQAPDGVFPKNAARPEYLRQVLKAAANKRDQSDKRGQPIVLVIDGLDEFDSEGPGNVPLGLPAPGELPHKVFVIATRRPGSELLSLGKPVLWKTIEIDEVNDQGERDYLTSANTQDMRDYLTSVLDGPDPDPDLVRELRVHGMNSGFFTETLVNRCAGVWIYLKCFLDEVRAGRSPDDVMSLPEDLRDYYLEQIYKQWEADNAGADGENRKPFRIRALAMLAAWRRPATADELADLVGIDSDQDKGKLRHWLNSDIRPFLDAPKPADRDDPRRYTIFHQSLRDLMADPDQPDREADGGLGDELRHEWGRAHAAITVRLMPPGPPGQRDWAHADAYVRDVIAEHAANSAPSRLAELVTDPGFLLVCQPSSVLSRRRYLKKTSEASLAVRAYEAALNEWAARPLDDSERAWWLHVWARKTGASDLAVECSRLAGRTPVIQAAIWTGTTHRVLDAHEGAVMAVAVVPTRDGPVLASGGSDGIVRLWDPATGTPKWDTRDHRGDWVMAVAPVPLRDGRTLLAAGSRDGTICLWDLGTGDLVAEHTAARSGPVNAIAVAMLADNRTVLATGTGDGAVRLWDPATLRPAGDALRHNSDGVMAMAPVPFRDKRTLLATGSGDGMIRLWDPATGLLVGEPVAARSGPMNTIAVAVLAHDRAVLATGSGHGTVQLWDPATVRPLRDPVAVHGDAVNAITVAKLADRTVFVSGGQDRTVRLWDPDTGKEVPYSLAVHAWVKAIAAMTLPDGRTLIATGGSDGKIELQELQELTGAAVTDPPAGHSDAVTAIAVANLAGRTVLVTGSRDRTVRLWDAVTGKSAASPLAGHKGPIDAVAAVPLHDGPTLISASVADGAVRLRDPAAPESESWPLKRNTPAYAITAVEVLDRTLLATGGIDGKVRLWNPETGELVGGPLAGHVGAINAIAAVPVPGRQALLATGGSDGTVRLWDPAAGAAFGDSLVGSGGRILAVAAVRLRDPDGRVLLAAGGEYGMVQLWDWERGTRIAVAERRTGNTGPVQRPGKGLVQVSGKRGAPQVNAITAVELPDRTLLATGGSDGMVRLWDPVTGQPAGNPFGKPLAGHVGAVNAIATVRLPGQTLLATGGSDNAVLIWAFDE